MDVNYSWIEMLYFVVLLIILGFILVKGLFEWIRLCGDLLYFNEIIDFIVERWKRVELGRLVVLNSLKVVSLN